MKKIYRAILKTVVAIGGLAIFIAILYFLGIWLGYIDFSFFLEAHGSLIAGIIAVLTAFFTIRFERNQFKKNLLEKDRRESLDLLFQVQEYSICLSKYLDLDGNETFNGGKITKEDVDKVIPLSRAILRRTIIIRSYLEDSGRDDGLCFVDIIAKQSVFFNNYLNYMRGGGPLSPTQVICLNSEVSEIIEAHSNTDKYEALYPSSFKFDERKLHGCYRASLSNAWCHVSNDVSEKLIAALLKK